MIRETIQKLLPETEAFLCELMRFPSTPGQEHQAMEWLYKKLSRPGWKIEKVPMSDALKSDPDYSSPIADIKYDDRFNLRVERTGRGKGKTLLINAHTDVVPPSEGMQSPWNPRVEQGVVWGRGACDDKGQVAVFYLVLRVLEELGIQLPGNLVGHLVVEEENGGNGSLAMARHGEKADACIVLEASEGKVYTSIRGAVWFRLTFHGHAGHSGQAGVTRSALLMARDAMAILEKYHADLLKASRGHPLFDVFPNPMPITFGKLQAGNWPAAAPSQAILEGVLGLLPNTTKEQVCEGMRNALKQSGNEALANHFDLEFMYRHDSSVIDPQHPLPAGMLAVAKEAQIPLEIGAMTASCDAWFYNNQLNIPTVVYGAGTLKVAHSKEERIAMDDIAKAAEILIQFTKNFCH